MASPTEQVIQLLTHWEPAVREQAVQELALRGDARAVEPLIRCLRDADNSVRRAAAIALGRIGDAQALEPLVLALRYDADRVVRRRAATALGELEDVRAREPLVQALKDVASGVPGYAALALDKLGETWLPSLEETLGEPDAKLRWRILLSLTHFQVKGKRPLGVFVAALKDASIEVRYSAVWALADISTPNTIDPLIEALSDEYDWCRKAAAEALGKLKAYQAVGPLIAALYDAREDEHGWARQAAARALASIGDERAVKPMAELIEQDNSELRATASWALGHMGRAGFTALQHLLRHPHAKARWWAVAGLAYHGAYALETVASALHDVDAEVRSKVIHSLADMDADKAVDLIIPMLRDTSANVRWDAAQTLGRVGDGRAVSALTRVRDTDAGETTYRAYERKISQVAADALFLIRRREQA